MLAGYDTPRHLTTISAAGAITEIKTDLWGNRLSITDPDAGKIISTYTKFNELETQTDANGNKTSYKYDQLGRVTQKKFTANDNSSQTIDYIYDYLDRNNQQKGKLYQINIDGVSAEVFYYDHLGRLSQHKKKVDGTFYTQSHTYNANGQLQLIRYPDNFKVTYTYTSTGKLDEIRNSDNNTLIYKVNSRNKYNQPTKCTYGNEVVTEYDYNPYGLLTRINTGKKNYSFFHGGGGEAKGLIGGGAEPGYWVDSTILNYRYAYNDKGLMSSRSERVIKRFETFQYDNLDRLTKATSGVYMQIFSYANNGNIDNNSTLGTYRYGTNMKPPKPHAVTEIDLIHPSVMAANTCAVTYNSFNQPTQITEGDYELNLFYNANQQRNKTMRYKNGALENTHYYFNKYFEIDIDSTQVKRYYNYVYGDNGVVALNLISSTYVLDTIGGGMVNDSIWWPNDRGMVLTDSTYFIHTDHLGSYCALTNANKKVVQRNDFDPWGNIRYVYVTVMDSLISVDDSISIGEPYRGRIPLNFTLTNRGFTGHEHYPYFKIINMNGRLYDPVIGRFFSPDNFVQSYDHTQSFNRYTYARNCPLMYTDPSGQWEYNWYVESNFWMPIGDNGVNYTQYVNIMNGYGANEGTYAFSGPATNLSSTWKMDAFGAIYFSISCWDHTAFGAGHWYSTSSLSGVYSPGYYYGDNIYTLPNYNIEHYNSSDYTPFASGRVEYSPINVEDFIFIGQFFKGLYFGAKALVERMVATSVEGGVAEATAIAAAATTTAKEVGKYSVYQGFDAANKVGYVGITSRTPAIRFAEHAASNTARSTLRYRVVDGATSLTKTQARILEQNLINQHGLENLLNLRNSIDPKYWWLYDIKP